jgi:hypothetical protein
MTGNKNGAFASSTVCSFKRPQRPLLRNRTKQTFFLAEPSHSATLQEKYNFHIKDTVPRPSLRTTSMHRNETASIQLGRFQPRSSPAGTTLCSMEAIDFGTLLPISSQPMPGQPSPSFRPVQAPGIPLSAIPKLNKDGIAHEKPARGQAAGAPPQNL